MLTVQGTIARYCAYDASVAPPAQVKMQKKMKSRLIIPRNAHIPIFQKVTNVFAPESWATLAAAEKESRPDPILPASLQVPLFDKKPSGAPPMLTLHAFEKLHQDSWGLVQPCLCCALCDRNGLGMWHSWHGTGTGGGRGGSTCQETTASQVPADTPTQLPSLGEAKDISEASLFYDF